MRICPVGETVEPPEDDELLEDDDELPEDDDELLEDDDELLEDDDELPEEDDVEPEDDDVEPEDEPEEDDVSGEVLSLPPPPPQAVRINPKKNEARIARDERMDECISYSRE
jgi:hypothetical protein